MESQVIFQPRIYTSMIHAVENTKLDTLFRDEAENEEVLTPNRMIRETNQEVDEPDVPPRKSGKRHQHCCCYY